MRGVFSSERLLRPRIWMLGPAPRRPDLGTIETPGARALRRPERFGAGDLSSSSVALIVETALPTARRSWAPAVPVITTWSRAIGLDCIAKLATTSRSAVTVTVWRAGL